MAPSYFRMAVEHPNILFVDVPVTPDNSVRADELPILDN